ncbi:MAG: hypothetical protein ACK5OC_19985, partial [Pirellula sp.]
MSLRPYSEVEWTKEIDSIIGTVPDRVIAERFGIAVRSVAVRRHNLGIASTHREIAEAPKWSKSMDKQLGTMADTDLAKLLGIKRYFIRQRRAELGIPAFKTAPLPPPSQHISKKLVMTEARMAKLGTVPDTRLAQLWGVSSGTVTRHRKSLGIDPFRPGAELEWTTGMLNQLGELPDGAIAREYGVSFICVKVKRISLGIPPFGKTAMDPEPDFPSHVRSMIGKIPDKQLSDQFGVSRAHIQIYRALHGIPLAEYQKPLLHAWTKEEEALLGTISDGDVARRF